MGTATRIWFKEGRDQGRAEGKAEGKAEGRAEGKVEGRVEGKAETLARLLARRFGRPLAEVQARLAGADFTQLDRWLDAVLEAPTFEAVFGSRPRR